MNDYLKIEPLTRFSSEGRLHSFFKCSDRKVVCTQARLSPEGLHRYHFRSEHLKNKCIILALFK